jgi:spore coat polysaccharide biosynthesis protein SpsF
VSVLCVVQARTGSSRLPGKVLCELDGRPMLRYMLDRLAALRVDELVVATSDLPRDDAIAEIARAAGRRCVRGSESDVLARFARALDTHHADDVVRLTADCPLTDPEIVAAVLARHRETGADYTSNVFPRTFPKGLDVEVMRATALRAAAAEARDPDEREHVTPFLYRRPERFQLANLTSGETLGDERWTVDTAEDLAFVRSLVATMAGREQWAWREALAVVGPRRAVLAGCLVVRPATASDAEFFARCRSDPVAVRWSRSGRPVDPATHAQWFATALEQPRRRLRVAEVAGEAVGTLRVDVTAAVGEVGIAVAPAHRGRGLATPMLRALVADCAGDPQVVTLEAVVHPDNVASLRAFTRAGFAPVGDRDGFRLLRRPVRRPIEEA